MSLGDHTSGPWHIHEPINGYLEIHGNYDGDDGWGRIVSTHIADVLNGADEHANACLISAAPELLEALRHLINWADPFTEKQDPDDFDKAIALGRAAISKAEGQQ